MILNAQIKDAEVRVIDSDGSQLGIMSSDSARARAIEQNLDLVKISPNANPPVCRIIDYGKYKFEIAKKEKEARKKQKVVEIKEVRLSPNIDQHDFDTKVSNALKFLKGGDKLKITVRFRGREITHLSLGRKLLEKFVEKIEEFGEVEKNPKLEGKNMMMFVTPKKI